ncbi:penicillin-insensitive murein endopeptidase [Candidatus Accumulibacter sp. ACC003]|uniref:penicillin-insensitive murein endopeptidase n=1 Tax=Candidatus Accumulibacter sp. ACC003 TaxID=2823334 RepID=UPI0025BDD45A|nr:penicillin-insensitive murein endopeptidase [Candidatus Accumulibacter sp. ACC003]
MNRCHGHCGRHGRYGHYIAALLLAAWLTIGLAAAAEGSPWALLTAPSDGPGEVIGSVSNGCIAGAQALPAEGEGYVSIRRYRNRFYGHGELLRLVSELARGQARRGHGLVMVGDLSQPRGGLMSSSHRSHQNGLDVDIWFQLAASAEAANRDTANQADPPSMVSADGESLSALWGDDQQALLKAAADDPRVDRIFVNPVIKRGLCASEGEHAWLRKLRPWFGHDAHFHVRLRCPGDSRQCDQQAALPAGDGCGKDLDWWFSDEARQPLKRSVPRAEPVLPAACRALLSIN